MTPPADPAVLNDITDAQFFLMLAAAIMVMQFLYRIWDKRDNSKVIQTILESNAETLKAIQATVDGLGPHLERSRAVYGMVKELKGQHDVRDDDGRPMWYMPKEIIETQRELTQLTHVVATTQRHMVKIMDRQEVLHVSQNDAIKSALMEHQESCRKQHHELKDAIKDQK